MNPTHSILCSHGVHGDTGAYLDRFSVTQIRQWIAGDVTASELEALEKTPALNHLDDDTNPYREAIEDVNEGDLSQSGWGIIFARDEPKLSALKEALRPLIELRQACAGPLFHIFEGEQGYHQGEDHEAFLKRHKIPENGPVDPTDGMPYYLLLVGEPEKIPFHFQYHLGVSYAVGRICFDDEKEGRIGRGYRIYAEAVVAAATKALVLPSNAELYGFSHPDDNSTILSRDGLVRPLTLRLRDKVNSWFITEYSQRCKTQKENILGNLQKEQAPAFIFTAGHGVGFGPERTVQRSSQGALLCSDWPGPKNWSGPVPPEFFIAAKDLDNRINIHGSIVFMFGCYTAGTPQHSNFARRDARTSATPATRRRLAPAPFLAALPQKMLGHENGGALAVIGHVERAWSYSFWSQHCQQQTRVFSSTFKRLLKVMPVGYAMEYFSGRYAQQALQLIKYQSYLEEGIPVKDEELVACWTAFHDAGNYIIIGDPAVSPAVQP